MPQRECIRRGAGEQATDRAAAAAEAVAAGAGIGRRGVGVSNFLDAAEGLAKPDMPQTPVGYIP